MNEHTSTEAPREYGELFYSPDSVATILRVVAEFLEGDERRAVLRLSYDLPTTMPWHDHRRDSEQQTGDSTVCRSVQFRLQHDFLFGDVAMRLTCLLRRGSSGVRALDGQYTAGMADEQ